MLDKNYLIINRSPAPFACMKLAGNVALFTDEDGRPLDHGAVLLGDTVYAALYCDAVMNVTFVTRHQGRNDVITVLWHSREEYMRNADRLESAAGVRFSEQNIRINRYAEAIAEKLGNGVELRVTDAVRESEMISCPECGMLNPTGSPYCMDCGAELTVDR